MANNQVFDLSDEENNTSKGNFDPPGSPTSETSFNGETNEDQTNNGTNDVDTMESIQAILAAPSTSSTTARIAEDRADAASCSTSQNTRRSTPKTVIFRKHHGSPEREGSSRSRRSKMSTKRSLLDSEKPPREAGVKRRRESTDTNSDSDALEDMLDEIVQQQFLRPSTEISQNITLRHQDSLITLKSPGERGSKVVKLEIFPYGDCLRKPKNEWWKQATLRSQFLTYSDDSPVAKMVEQLSKEIFKQLRAVPKVDIETKSVGY